MDLQIRPPTIFHCSPQGQPDCERSSPLSAPDVVEGRTRTPKPLSLGFRIPARNSISIGSKLLCFMGDIYLGIYRALYTIRIYEDFLAQDLGIYLLLTIPTVLWVLSTMWE